MDEPTQKEILWRQYKLHVDLYKFYLDIVIKLNVLFYGITGGIITYYFTNSDNELARFALLLPIIMSLALGVLFFYGATLMRVVRIDLFKLRDQLALETAPDLHVLIVGMNVFGIIFIIIAMTLLFFILL